MLHQAIGHVADLIGLRKRDVPFLKTVYERALKDPYAYEPILIRKKRGGYRRIDIPNKGLKYVQRCIHHQLLVRRYEPTHICHSHIRKTYDVAQEYGDRWLPGRTIVSNAFAHLGVPPDVDPHDQYDDERIRWRTPCSLFAIDLKDAYPSVSEDMVFDVYGELAGDPWSAEILTRLSVWHGCLPQGAPTSPLLLNFVLRDLDAAIKKEFRPQHFCVTRYVDDVVLTSRHKRISLRIQKRLIDLVEAYGFKVNLEKNCYWQADRHVLRVTSVNLYPEERRVALSKTVVEQFRSLLYGLFTGLRANGFLLHSNLVADAFSRALDCEDPRVAEIHGMRSKQFHKMMGIIGFCHLVYGNELPKRLSAWGDRGGGDAMDVEWAIEMIKDGYFDTDVIDASYDASGYRVR
ncbi:MAG: hypothetical protein HY006_01830 [Candidatus Sungbacteria bacterium]|nr:hypothetical protein [Candidatus Sungbacteria bacterium]